MRPKDRTVDMWTAVPPAHISTVPTTTATINHQRKEKPRLVAFPYERTVLTRPASVTFLFELTRGNVSAARQLPRPRRR